jgi:hypothetical protein
MIPNQEAFVLFFVPFILKGHSLCSPVYTHLVLAME